jgi:hypothetical protein
MKFEEILQEIAEDDGSYPSCFGEYDTCEEECRFSQECYELYKELNDSEVD